MKHTLLAGTIILASLTTVHAKTFSAAVGDRIFIDYIRSPCTGGQPPSAQTVRGWLIQAPQHGKLEMNQVVRHKSRQCGKSLWMRKLYYRATSKGSDTIGLQFPENGRVIWRVQVR